MMARQPAGDERSVIPRPDPKERKERVFVTELVDYLHSTQRLVLKFCRRHGLLHRSRRFPNIKVYWVTPHGAMRVIAYVRACQGQYFIEGQDYHRLKERHLQDKRRQSARMKEKKAAAAQTGRLAFLGPWTGESEVEGERK